MIRINRLSRLRTAQPSYKHLSRVSKLTSSSTIVPPRSRAKGLVVRNESREQRLSRAKGYPYSRPNTSFIFCNGHPYTFPNGTWVPPSCWNGSLDSLLQLQVTAPDGTSNTLSSVLQHAGVHDSALMSDSNPLPMTPILAIGSNAGPEQLARKFPLDLFPAGVVVPVIECVLRDFDVVYAPLISSYGSATATLEHSPGTSVSVFVTYLTPALQQRMHETEGAYNLCKLTDVQLLEGISLQQHMQGVKSVQVQSTVYQYNHQYGTLHLPFVNPGSSPVALAEIQATGRRFPAFTQVEMQTALMEALKHVTKDELVGHGGAVHEVQPLPGVHLGLQNPEHHKAAFDEWILSNLEQHSLRRARVQALNKAARPFGYQGCEVMMVIGTAMSTSVK